ncbi:cytochrome C [Faecalibacterium prausnitzii]|uniref:cytochrome C n=1 Tax=Faecalibacterium prausnitzii TaxID=853 RepID=UPI003C2CCFE8
MKLKNAAVVAAALALAVGMTACGSSASSTAASSSVASSAAASSEAASSEAAASESAEPAEYTVYNTTGSTVTELYLYVAGSEDKGENLAGEGLADGENVVLTLPEDADQSAKYVLEFTTEDGQTQSFETLHYEVAPISLLSVDAAAGATPIAFSAPEQ